MKKLLSVAAVLIAAALMLTACKRQNNDTPTTEATTAASVIDDLLTTLLAVPSTEETTVPATTQADEPAVTVEEEPGSMEDGTNPSQESVTVPPSTTSVQPETQTAFPEVDLSITLPEANGKMYVDKNPSNKFTSAVNSGRHIDTSLLVAVYSLPESGQNYVFEFRSADSFSADNIRRVYLLNNSGKIIGVAASNASEKEKLSATENWFCMNVLIKGVIFPSIEEQFR